MLETMSIESTINSNQCCFSAATAFPFVSKYLYKDLGYYCNAFDIHVRIVISFESN